jgi:hypothetical protein
MSSRLAALALAALFSAGAFGQDSISATSRSKGFRGTAHFGAQPPFGIAPITGAPYSGEEVGEMVQTLADGTHITRTMPATKVYRDSAGRTRTERPMFWAPAGMDSEAPAAPILVEITDPVAQVKYFLDPQNKVAHRQGLVAPGAQPANTGLAIYRAAGDAPRGAIIPGGAAGAATIVGQILTAPPPNTGGPMPQAARPETSHENLGTQTIEGVAAEGTRQTMTWPTGSQGNDRPITSTNEMWRSRELQVMILSKMNDPRSGEHTQRLIHIGRSEPDPSLFQVPSDYTVVDEKADFTIEWRSPRQ